MSRDIHHVVTTAPLNAAQQNTVGLYVIFFWFVLFFFSHCTLWCWAIFHESKWLLLCLDEVQGVCSWQVSKVSQFSGVLLCHKMQCVPDSRNTVKQTGRLWKSRLCFQNMWCWDTVYQEIKFGLKVYTQHFSRNENVAGSEKVCIQTFSWEYAVCLVDK